MRLAKLAAFIDEQFDEIAKAEPLFQLDPYMNMLKGKVMVFLHGAANPAKAEELIRTAYGYYFYGC